MAVFDCRQAKKKKILIKFTTSDAAFNRVLARARFLNSECFRDKWFPIILNFITNKCFSTFLSHHTCYELLLFRACIYLQNKRKHLTYRPRTTRLQRIECILFQVVGVSSRKSYEN